MDEMILNVKHLSKSFGSHQVLRDIDFTVNKGDVISVIGASGSGKSTLLRCINLLETPSSGEILYHETNVLDGKVKPHEYRAHVGMVFQSFNLFNNMSVLENCMVGQQQVLKRSKQEAEKIAMDYLNKVGMAPYINAKPRQISGGQKQRVAIARATPVGVFPTCFWRSLPPKSLPHARGGVSSYSPVASLLRKSSPRPWGCFLVILKSLRLILVFPTPVGVFLRANRPWQCREGLPHARGGVSHRNIANRI